MTDNIHIGSQQRCLMLNTMKLLVVCLLSLSVASAARHIPSAKEYFDEIDNISELRWDHAANTNLAISMALNNTKEMIEADVVVTPSGWPYMGHNEGDRVDIYLQGFLDRVIKLNQRIPHSKGVKLDFKSTRAFEVSMKQGLLLHGNSINRDIVFPFWINADILKGPGAVTDRTVDLSLAENAAKLEGATLSLGWTTGTSGEGYTDENISEMLAAVKPVEHFDITYPVRAMYAAESIPQMLRLLEGERRTLTIWSGATDTEMVDVKKLNELIKGREGVIYVDVPEDLMAKMEMARVETAGGADKTVAGILFAALALMNIFY